MREIGYIQTHPDSCSGAVRKRREGLQKRLCDYSISVFTKSTAEVTEKFQFLRKISVGLGK